MAQNLARIPLVPKTGNEPFHHNFVNFDFSLLEFWKWSFSDIVSNATRGVLAEFIVAKALGISTEGARDEWARYDLKTADGITIQVKSAAYLQSWHQERFSSISFDIRKTRGWDADTNKQDAEAKRHADVYVFALLAHTDKGTVDPLNVGQWRFYVVPTSKLDARIRSQDSITLKCLEDEYGKSVLYFDLPKAVRDVRNVE